MTRRGASDVRVRRAYLELAEGSPALAREALEEPLELRRALNDRRGIGIVLAGLGLMDTLLGDHDGAARELADARDLFRRAGDRWGLASALWRTADLELARGRPDEADLALAEAVTVLGETRRTALARACGLPPRASWRSSSAGRDQAEELFDEARRLYAAGSSPDLALLETALERALSRCKDAAA